MFKNRMVMTGLMIVVGAAAAGAQMGRQQIPRMRGIWDPVVGAGGVYQIESKDYKGEMEYAIVGTENVGGKPGHWLEMTMKGREGAMVMKHLWVLEGKQTAIKRMIFQMGDEQPMEMPANMGMGMGRPQQEPQPADIRETAERVGAESVTTPAGTFACEHWRAKDNSGDFWIAEKVAPFGVVKATTPGGSMTLVRTISNAKTKIRGTPVIFDPAEMMRRQNPQ